MSDVFHCAECNMDVIAKPRANSDFFDCPKCLNAVGYRVTKPDVTFNQGNVRRYGAIGDDEMAAWTHKMDALVLRSLETARVNSKNASSPDLWPTELDAPVIRTDALIPNPKTLMGRQKLSVLSVVPPASILREAEAMHYGAYEAPRKDGTKGYGPYNWRDDPVELMIYVDACMRHLLAYVDGEGTDPESGVTHLGHAKACLGIIADADANGTLIDNRPAVRKSAASSLLNRWKLHHKGDQA